MTVAPTQEFDLEPSLARAMTELLARPLALTAVELCIVVVPQVEGFRSALGVRNERRALLVRALGRDGAWGIGESSCRPDPWFNGEFVDGALTVLAEHVLPRLGPETDLARALMVIEKTRGWPFTRAALLDALVDLLRRRGLPDLLDHWPGERSTRVPVGISLGLFPDGDTAIERVGRAVDQGYRRIKLKVQPTMDLGILRAIRRAFPAIALGFDANGSCGAEDFGFLTRLAELEPVCIEQPFAPDRLDLCQELRRRDHGTPLCLDESIASSGQLVSAHRLGALDELNLKPGRVGGPFETLKILAYCREHALPAWVGGMFETGIGRLANLRVAALLPDARAHDLSPSSRYFTTDVVRRPLEMDTDGTIALEDPSPPVLAEKTLERLTETRRRIALGKGDRR